MRKYKFWFDHILEFLSPNVCKKFPIDLKFAKKVLLIKLGVQQLSTLDNICIIDHLPKKYFGRNLRKRPIFGHYWYFFCSNFYLHGSKDLKFPEKLFLGKFSMLLLQRACYFINFLNFQGKFTPWRWRHSKNMRFNAIRLFTYISKSYYFWLVPLGKYPNKHPVFWG